MLLLRRAVFALRRAGHDVTIMAPSAAGAALVGPGPGEAQALLAFEDAEVATLFGGPVAPRLRERLAWFDLAVAYTRNAALLKGLSSVVSRAVIHDPAPPDAAVHISRRLVEPLNALGITPGDVDPPLLQFTAEEDAAAASLRRALPRRFLAVHPGSGSLAKSWPKERFVEFIDTLDAGPFLLVVGPADADAAAPLRDHRNAVIADNLKVRRLAALLGQAAVFVGNDSGVTHLAAAAGAPTVALFGPTDPAVWAPVGANVRVLRGRSERVDGLEVEEVVEATRTFLIESRTRAR